MKKNPYSGKFIVFEGLDGSGQSTQVALLEEFLKTKRYKVLKTKEPTKQSRAGRIIEKALNKKTKISPKKLQELFCQDRKWHLKNVVIPALKKDKIVICDRYFFSTLAYGMAEGLSLKNLTKLNEKFLLPDIIFFLDVKPAICLQRIEKRGEEKALFEEKEKLEKVYVYYKKALKEFEKVTKIFIINGERSIEEVFSKIKKIIQTHM